jgi:hypothetical protein
MCWEKRKQHPNAWDAMWKLKTLSNARKDTTDILRLAGNPAMNAMVNILAGTFKSLSSIPLTLTTILQATGWKGNTKRQIAGIVTDNS